MPGFSDHLWTACVSWGTHGEDQLASVMQLHYSNKKLMKQAGPVLVNYQEWTDEGVMYRRSKIQKKVLQLVKEVLTDVTENLV